MESMAAAVPVVHGYLGENERVEQHRRNPQEVLLVVLIQVPVQG